MEPKKEFVNVNKAFRFARISDRTLRLSLLILAVLSVLLAILDSIGVLHVNATWIIPVVLIALFAIIQTLDPVEEIHSDVRYLRTQAPEVKVQRFQGPKDFYTVYNGAIRNASASLDLTHIRRDSPERFGAEAEASTRLVTDFVDTGGSVRRIIAIRNDEIKAWARHLDKESRDQNNYHVCVVNWMNDVPPINMAIVDAKAVFLTVAGSTPDRVNGIGIEDAVIGEYFSAYYEQLYTSGVELSEWLRGHP
jgi:hypothetical protein